MVVRRLLSSAAVALVAALVAALLALLVPSCADAARPLEATRCLDFLHASQGADGRLGDASYTPWAVIAIAASGENPAGSAWTRSGRHPIGYLQGTDLASAATSGVTGNAPAFYAKTILAYVAAGRGSSLSCAGSKRIDLVRSLLAYQRSDGRFSPVASSPYVGAVNTTTWAIIALEAAGVGSSASAKAVEWLKGEQLADGGFSSMAKDGPGTPVSDVDDTAAAVQALVAGGVSPSSSGIRKARAYLQGVQNADGGFSSLGSGGPTYSESTAWALQAILAMGESPTSSAWNKGGKNPQSALRSLQAPNGALYHRRGLLAAPLLSTTQSLIALSGKTFSSFPRGGARWVSPFVAAPSVTRLSPANGSIVAPGSVKIGAGYRDGAGGTGIAVSGVHLFVDGRELTRQAKITADSLGVTVTGVATGRHTVVVQLRDSAGNGRQFTSVFTAQSGAPVGGSGGATSSAGGSVVASAASPASPSGGGSSASGAAAVTGADATPAAAASGVDPIGVAADLPSVALSADGSSPMPAAGVSGALPSASSGSGSSLEGSNCGWGWWWSGKGFGVYGGLLILAAAAFLLADRTRLRLERSMMTICDGGGAGDGRGSSPEGLGFLAALRALRARFAGWLHAVRR